MLLTNVCNSQQLHLNSPAAAGQASTVLPGRPVGRASQVSPVLMLLVDTKNEEEFESSTFQVRVSKVTAGHFQALFVGFVCPTLTKFCAGICSAEDIKSATIFYLTNLESERQTHNTTNVSSRSN